MIALATPVLAFQVGDAIGWAGQAVFAWRMLEQWVLSERAKRSVLPPSFWAWSLLGSAFLIAYAVHRREPVYLLGALVNASIYARNVWMSRPSVLARRGSHRALWPVVVGVLVFAGISLEAMGPDHGLVRFDYTLPWLVAGFAGQVLWSGRFVVQWWVSERMGRSVLPPAFFVIGLFGSFLSLAYAIFREDWVNIAAYALNPLPYVRNLVLIRRRRDRAADRDDVDPAVDP